MNLQPPKPHTHQKGLALIIALVFLLVLTVVGLSSTKGVRTQVLMSNNFEASSVSFQAAEEALRAAENILANTVFDDANDFWDGCSGSNCFTDNCNNGLCKTADYPNGQPGNACITRADKIWTDSTKWANAGSLSVSIDRTDTVGEAEITMPALYLIEFRCYIQKVAAPSGTYNASEWSEYYRITVSVDGPAGKAPVMLQSTYRKN